MPASDKSRDELPIGAVFIYRQFEGVDATKDRFFVVVGTTPESFLCFTTSTQEYILKRFAGHAVHLPEGSTCLPKECCVDCRRHYTFDDIEMSNKLSCGNAKLWGRLDDDVLRRIAETLNTAKMLDRAVKAQIQKTILDTIGL